MKIKPPVTIFFLLLVIAISFEVYFEFQRRKKAEVKTSGALEALELWTAQRAYPQTVIPDVGHYKACERSRELFKRAQAQIPCPQPWRPIGPHNIGGRTVAIAFNSLNPNTIYAGSASGGLWKSRTAGLGANAWEYVNTGFPVLGVSAIAVAPDDSNTIYIGTGEVYGYQNADIGLGIRTARGSYGIGILKSADGGETWVKSLDWSYSQRRGVQVLEINPLNSSTVWAGTTEGTYKSTDAGSTWTQVNSTIMVTDLVLNPIDTNTVFIACGNLRSPGHGIYRTTDGGNSWTRLHQGLPVSFGGKAMLAMYESSPNVLFASIGNGYASGAGTWLCKSVDNGETWTIVSNIDYASYQGWYSHFVGVNPVDSSQVICGGIELWKSTNGGTNLEQKSHWTYIHGTPPVGGPEGPPDYIHVDLHAIAYHPTNPDMIYFGTDGGVFRSIDGGETFGGCNGGYQTTQFYNGFSSAQTDSLVAMGGLQDNYTAIYEGTVAWRRVLYGDGAWTAIHPGNPRTMYGSYQWLGHLYASFDGGETWIELPPPYGGEANFVSPFILCSYDPQVCYAGLSYVYKSIDGGRNWFKTNNGQELDGNPVLSLAASTYSCNVVYAGTAPIFSRAGIFRTVDGGTSWQNITADLPDRYPVDIAVDPADDAVVYVVFSGFGSSHVFKSTDGGDHWQDIGGMLPDVPTSAVIVHPLYSDHIYVGNDIGVFVTTDGGNSWTSFHEGLPQAVIVMDLSISTISLTLRAATHGNGVYERPLLGLTGVDKDEHAIPSSYELYQNYPNPFNATTTITFRISEAGMVNLAVYNAAGQLVEILVDEQKGTGLHMVEWNARGVASGVYFYRLTAGTYTSTKKCVIVR
ncbi:MAG: hypothetical protein AMJ92_05125 [candidate division Zixibacteria bacterium SM23_81]|nr:MAG: hypothetical protein AMJ92_05125 [candidate division Zixibacteria bacterium SM23_81]